jgi:hypothetical protein
MNKIQQVDLVEGDVTSDFEPAARDAATVAWDIETSGLDWRLDQIGTCQLHVPDVGTQIIRMNGTNLSGSGSCLQLSMFERSSTTRLLIFGSCDIIGRPAHEMLRAPRSCQK